MAGTPTCPLIFSVLPKNTGIVKKGVYLNTLLFDYLTLNNKQRSTS